MRKWIALFVLLVLPLQMAFAAAAEYCESGKGHDSHFGHHVHKAENMPDSKSGHDKAAGASDCGFCALGCSHAQVATFTFGAAVISASHHAASSPDPDGNTPPLPDRPPRTSLA